MILPSKKIRVLIVDDSAVVRKMAAEALRADPAIEVVGTATDPYYAQEKIRATQPDVLTLDLEMPRMDGLTFLELLMAKHPIPVIVMSSLTQKGSDYALEALRMGAVDIIGKPAGPYSFGDLSRDLVAKVKIAAGVRPRSAVPVPSPAAPPAAPSPTRSPLPEQSDPNPNPNPIYHLTQANNQQQ